MQIPPLSIRVKPLNTSYSVSKTEHFDFTRVPKKAKYRQKIIRQEILLSRKLCDIYLSYFLWHSFIAIYFAANYASKFFYF